MALTNLLYTAHVPAGDGPFPTVLALHGWGASAHDLLGLAPLIHGGEALVLCPQGETEVPIGGPMPGYGWFPLVPGSPPEPAAFLHAAESLRTFYAAAQEVFPIDAQRTAVLGFSQGGLMAYEFALRQPGAVSGLAALSSWFPQELADHLPAAPEHQDFPVLVVHGTSDPLVDIERARDSRERLRHYGVSLTYREFGMGHEIRPDALKVILEWLERRVFA